ncbi:MAG: ribonuclease Z, partial [Bacillota bacterium]|nr:ribonuclease Z [Bacillota bacterium]
MLDVCLLGCGGSLPVPERNLTSLLLSCRGKKILIDCGEGTQVSMKILGWGFKSIDVICFTHAHADHVIGLPGLLLTIANSDRTDPLVIIGPPGFSHVLQGLMVVCPQLPYEIFYKEASLKGDTVYDSDGIYLSSFGLDHNIPCVGYSLEVKRGRKFDVQKAKSRNIPQLLWSRLQKGESIREAGLLYTPDMVMGEDREGIKVSYFTDTRPLPGLTDFIAKSSLLVA